MTRLLEGSTDDLYAPGSDACHLALRQLWDVFDHLGFKVVKKSANETTLRVYPERMHRYPLLNHVSRHTLKNGEPTSRETAW